MTRARCCFWMAIPMLLTFPLGAAEQAQAEKEEAGEMLMRVFHLPAEVMVMMQETDDDAVVVTDPFATQPQKPPAEPASAAERVRRRVSSQKWLEAQGITFPEGAQVFFDATAGVLTVKNTEPNLELAAAFADTILKYTPVHVTHQLTVIEGPAERLLQLNAKATSLPGIRRMLDMLLADSRKPDTQVRVVGDAFIDSTRETATSAAGREHTRLSSTPQIGVAQAADRSNEHPGGPTTTHGLTLEVTTKMGEDGSRMETAYRVDFQPLRDAADADTTGETGVHLKGTLKGPEGTNILGMVPCQAMPGDKGDRLCAFFLTRTPHRIMTMGTPLVELGRVQRSPTPLPQGLETWFLVPKGLFEMRLKNKPPRPAGQPLLEWFASHGIPPAKGAQMEYSGGILHVVNTWENLESIGSLLVEWLNQVPRVAVFTWHTLEAPAPLVRELMHRHRHADSGEKSSLWDEMESAADEGEARFIDSGLASATAHATASHRSVRAHHHLSHFNVEANGKPQMNFATRDVGSVLKVVPSPFYHGMQTEARVTHELHALPPETHPETFTDAVRGQEFQIPATDFQVRKTTCDMLLDSGRMRLLSLHPASGHRADGAQPDLLWATFLRCDIMPLVAQPRSSVVPATTAPKEPDTDKLQTRTYRVPPDFLQTGGGLYMTDPSAANDPFAQPFSGSENDPFSASYQNRPADPFGAPGDENDKATDKTKTEPAPTKKGVLGIQFPEGASASFDAATSTVTVRNSPENHARVETYLDRINLQQPATLSHTMHVFQGPGPLLRSLIADAVGSVDHREQLNELLAAVKEGTVKAITTARLETDHQTPSIVKQGREQSLLSAASITAEGSLLRLQETQHIGLELSAEPTRDNAGLHVSLPLGMTFHTAPPQDHTAVLTDPNGRKTELPLTDLHLIESTTRTLLFNGATRIHALWKPTGNPKLEKEDVLQVMFITCDVLRAGK